jgi:hypothetical protein
MNTLIYYWKCIPTIYKLAALLGMLGGFLIVATWFIALAILEGVIG